MFEGKTILITGASSGLGEALGRRLLEEGYFESLPLSTFREVFDVNYFGTLHCTKAVLPHFMQSGAGRIVNIASLGGKIASFGYSAYASSKHALVGLTEVLRLELTPQGIGVTLVCPGEFESPMVEKLNTYRTRENAVVTQTVPVLPLAMVVEEIVSGLAKERYLIIPGRTARLVELASRWFPSLFRRITDWKVARAALRV